MKVIGCSTCPSQPAGHSYDLLKGVNPETDATQEMYFNIDAIMGALDRKLSE